MAYSQLQLPEDPDQQFLAFLVQAMLILNMHWYLIHLQQMKA